MPDVGFILQPTYRLHGGRPIVQHWGRLLSGETFLVLDDRAAPYFYVLADDAERACELGAPCVLESPRVTMDGRPVARVEARTPPDVPALRDRLRQAGVACFEADVRFALRHLIDRGVRALAEIDGPWRPAPSRQGPGIDRVYRNPELRPAVGVPRLAILSFDIETDPRARRLLSIALHFRGIDGEITSEVLLFRPRAMLPEGAAPTDGLPPETVPFAAERDLLAAFAERVRHLDPDLLTGWNVIDFDLRVLDEMSRRLRVPLRLGRGPISRAALRLRPSRSPWGGLDAAIPGRLVLDGIHLLRSSFVRMDSMGLDHVAREVLGEGKTLGHEPVGSKSTHDEEGRVTNKAQEILDTWRHDLPRFVEYNRTDARLVLDILDKLRLIPLAIERSRLTGLPLDRVGGSIAAFDFLYLMELGKRGLVAPSMGEGFAGESSAENNLGGWVLEPEPGLWENVLVLDFKSLYPSLIRTFHIDPLGYLGRPPPGDSDPRSGPIRAPNGAYFRRQEGILPGLLDDLFPRREIAKAAGDTVASHAIKILMNSFYGVLGTTACRFARPAIAGAITAFGREILRWTKARLEELGYRVLYGDTDSVFVLSGAPSPERARELGDELAKRLTEDVAAHIAATWGAQSRLELEFERLYLRLVLLETRHGSGGARKRYVGLVENGGEGDGEKEVVFTGMEVVRRDWTELAKEVQRELYERLFHDRGVETYLRETVEKLRGGQVDASKLIYRKGLLKPLGEYTATTPPHVAAARKMRGKPGRVVDYVMTVQGAEPAAERRSAVDVEHYVQKQVRPVAEPVLAVLGLEFDKVVGDDGQMELF